MVFGLSMVHVTAVVIGVTSQGERSRFFALAVLLRAQDDAARQAGDVNPSGTGPVGEIFTRVLDPFRPGFGYLKTRTER